MKVAIFFTFDYSINTWYESGTLERELSIYNELNRIHGTEFIFITYGDASDKDYQRYLNDFKILPIYSIIKYKKNRFLRFLISFTIPFKIKKYLNDVSIIQQHQLLGAWVPIILKYLLKKPLVVRTGYDMLEFSKKEKKNFILIFFYKLLTVLTVKLSNIYTVASSSDYKLNEKYFKNNINKLKLRPNWVEPGEKINFKNRYRNKFLSVGRLVSQKNYELLINEFKDTQDFLSFDIVGTGDQKESLELLAKEKKVKINFLGNLSHSDLLNQYQKYKYFISTSSFEGNPKSLLEAMVSGCVVIASDIPNHQELIEDKETGILFNIETPNLLKIYKELTTDEKLLNKISTNAIKKIKNSNSLEFIVSNSHGDYLSLLN